MGYRGKIAEQNRARDLRARGWTYNEIAAEVGVPKSSVSLWSGIPPDQFTRPYRALADPSIRKCKHPMGCPNIRYASVEVHRKILGLVDALLHSTIPNPG